MKSTPVTPAALKRAVQFLRQGKVIAHPADTCFGLAADPFNPVAVARVQEIKGRDGEKPMSLMLPILFLPKLAEYAVLSDFSRRVCDKLLLGPVTILLPRGPLIPKHYFPETDLVGLRMPNDGLTQMLLVSFGGPLITTSANRSGEPLTYTDEAVIEAFKNAPADPDMILAGTVKEGPASTVLALSDGHLKIVRPGQMRSEDIEKAGFRIR